MGQRCGQHAGIDHLDLSEALGHAAQQLAEDHAGVAPRSHQRTMRDGVAYALHGQRLVEAVEARHHRLDGQGHVGSGVAVGYRVHVEAVHDVLVAAQHIAIGGENEPYIAR